MNAFLKGALEARKKVVDAHATEAVGTGSGIIGVSNKDKDNKKTYFYTGDIVEKSETGFSGLLNQGATCYLNSLIQTLFMTPELRESVYKFIYDPEIHPREQSCIPLQLQKLFARMQISIRGAVRTATLTDAFGWKGRQVYVQHDVLELSDQLFDHLERQSVGTDIGTVISNLYRGAYQDYAQCMTCEHFRGRLTPCVGFGLDIEKVETFHDAMNAFIKPEMLDGSNAVTCDRCDTKTPTKKGIRFMSMPYFLSIHLRRWTFNFMTLMRVKIQKKVRFPLYFDATQYLDSDGDKEPVEWFDEETFKADMAKLNEKNTDEGDNNDKNDKNNGNNGQNSDKTTKNNENNGNDSNEGNKMIYELYSIYMHTGGASGGHYFAYIKDFESGNWLRFNDSRVELIPKEEFKQFFTEEEKLPDPKNKNTTGSKNGENAAPTPAPLPGGAAAPVPTAAPVPGGSTAPEGAAAADKNDANKDKEDNKDSKDSKDSKKDSKFDVGAALAAKLKNRTDKDTAVKMASTNKEYRDSGLAKLNGNKDENTKKEKKKTFLNPKGAAYNLMYRLVDPSRNVNKVDKSLIPETIVTEISKEDEIYAKHKAQYDYEKQFVAINVWYDNKVKSIKLKKAESLESGLKDIIYNELEELKDKIDLKNIRLRKYNELKNVPLEPLTDIMDQTVENIGIKAMLVETKQDNEEWKVYEPEKLSVRMIELDPKNMEFKESVIVQITELGKIGDMRLEFAKTLKLGDTQDAANRVRIFRQADGIAALLSADSELIVKDAKINAGDSLHVEICEKHHTEGQSLLMKKFDQILNTIFLKYNLFLKDTDLEEKYDQVIEIDVRKTLGDLREQLAAKLEVTIDNLKIRTNYNDKELKNNKKTLSALGLGPNSHVFCEKGKPLKPTEYLFHIYIEDELYKKKKAELDQKRFTLNAKKKAGAKIAALKASQKDNKNETTEAEIDEKELSKQELELGDAFLFMGSVVLDKKWDMNQVKEHISGNVENVPTPDYMRIREFANNRLTRVYFDDKTLGKNAGYSIKDQKVLCCQKTETANESFDKSSLLIYVTRWYPEKLTYSAPTEMSIKKSFKVKSDLRSFLSNYSGIPIEHIRCEHPRPYILKAGDIEKICILDWDNHSLGTDNTVASKPWSSRSGDFIIFKDNREKELFDKDELNKGLAQGVSVFAQAEVPLVIETPEEQIKREERERLQKIEDEKKREQDRKDAEARYVAKFGKKPDGAGSKAPIPASAAAPAASAAPAAPEAPEAPPK